MYQARLFFFVFFVRGGGVVGSGTPWVVITSGLLPDNTGFQWEMNNFGGGDKHS